MNEKNLSLTETLINLPAPAWVVIGSALTAIVTLLSTILIQHYEMRRFNKRLTHEKTLKKIELLNDMKRTCFIEALDLFKEINFYFTHLDKIKIGTYLESLRPNIDTLINKSTLVCSLELLTQLKKYQTSFFNMMQKHKDDFAKIQQLNGEIEIYSDITQRHSVELSKLKDELRVVTNSVPFNQLKATSLGNDLNSLNENFDKNHNKLKECRIMQLDLISEIADHIRSDLINLNFTADEISEMMNEELLK